MQGREKSQPCSARLVASGGRKGKGLLVSLLLQNWGLVSSLLWGCPRPAFGGFTTSRRLCARYPACMACLGLLSPALACPGLLSPCLSLFSDTLACHVLLGLGLTFSARLPWLAPTCHGLSWPSLACRCCCCSCSRSMPFAHLVFTYFWTGDLFYFVYLFAYYHYYYHILLFYGILFRFDWNLPPLFLFIIFLFFSIFISSEYLQKLKKQNRANAKTE